MGRPKPVLLLIDDDQEALQLGQRDLERGFGQRYRGRRPHSARRTSPPSRGCPGRSSSVLQPRESLWA